ncbi:hypothetical protein IscW_ISCW021941 [Ixodes scapularis]|uniref:Secreted protein n=1 Tax=Ixodes scapularis TaxID=6945 RepID=B7QG99_IXOSC|nr:hypothetical protein IscW_ISCW021941 [Ixodes scapularis]|eukprot:XP_002401357.1 hypothetical protein IscW_ISCW021941 [Ixodes scapularis]
MFCLSFPFFSFFHLFVPLRASFAMCPHPRGTGGGVANSVISGDGDVNCSLRLQLFEQTIVSLGHCSLLWSSMSNPGPYPEICVCFSFCSSSVFPRNTGSICYAVKFFCFYCQMQKKRHISS